MDNHTYEMLSSKRRNKRKKLKEKTFYGQTVAIGHQDYYHYTTSYLWHYLYFTENYNLIAIDVVNNNHLILIRKKCSKFLKNLDWDRNTKMFISSQEAE